MVIIAGRKDQRHARPAGHDPAPGRLHGEFRYIRFSAGDVLRHDKGDNGRDAQASVRCGQRHRLVRRAALESPESYKDRKIAIAGDELNLAEILAVYKRVVGKAPAVAPLPGFAPRLMLPKDMYLMLRWFAEAGYKGDIAAIRREHPGALTFEAWLRQSAGGK
jgi:hypothetical protein